jgi:spermidine/putrescine ABC transporter ATP-binding subunit
MTAPLLTLSGIEKRYGTTLAVGPVDIDVRAGELLTLLGPSGCGKTTTLHIVAGLVQPDAGRVTMAGRDITDLEPKDRDMGVVFQSYALFPHKTVFDNIAFGLRMRRVGKSEIADRVREVLETVGLPGVEGRYPRQLSGGQRQRVAVARALVFHPKVLLLDEPLSNLDAVLRKHMRRELRRIQQRVGITAIFVTHDQDEAFEMSDRVILMNKGRVEQVGTPEELYDEPRTRFAAEFIGEANVIAGKVVAAANGAATVQVAPGIAFRAAADDGVQVGAAVQVIVRPERVALLREPPGAGGVPGRVVERVFSGDLVRFTVEIEHGFALRSTKPNAQTFRDIRVEEKVWVVPEHCRAVQPDA